jgi:hypothetical protein
VKLKRLITIICALALLLQSAVFALPALAAGENRPYVTEYGLYNYIDSNTQSPGVAGTVLTTGNTGADYTAPPWTALTDVPYTFDGNMVIGIRFAVNVATPTQWENNRTCLQMYDAANNPVVIDVLRSGDGTNQDINRNYIYVVPGSQLAPESSYRITIDAALTANNGNSADVQQEISITTIADTTIPAWPAGSSLTASSVGSSSLTLSWSPATDDVAVTGYRILREGSSPINVDGLNTICIVDGLAADTTYNFKVEAGDAAGNWSSDGPAVSAATTATSPSADVSLDLSTSSTVSRAYITASGTAAPNRWVTIQVLDSVPGIVFFDAVKSDTSGNYSKTFRVPDVASGTLTVITGYGSNVAAANLYVAAVTDINSGNVEADGSNKNLAITNSTPGDVSITVPNGVDDGKIIVADLLSADGSGGLTSSPLPSLNITTGLTINSTPVQVTVAIPAGTMVSAPDGWDGTINVPTVQASNTVSVTPDAGKNATVNSVIEIGYGDVPLTFNKAVRILIPGQAGKDVGYYRNGQFTRITNTLSADTQAVGDALAAGGDGRIDVGNDLVIWTKHFTSFVTYTQTASNPGGGGTTPGGGGNGDGTGANAGDRNFWVEQFTLVKNSSSSYTLRFDLSNGMDREIPGNLSKVHVYKKSDRTLIPYSSYNYIKQGTNDNPPKIRRLELTFSNLFKDGESYLVEIDPDFTANNGNTFGTMYTTEFTIGATATTPVAGNNSSFGSAGGTLNGENATIVIPAGAFSSDIKITIEKVSNISSLPSLSGGKILGSVVEIKADRSGEFNQAVTITLTFDKTLVDLEKNRVSIYWLDEKTGKWNELKNVKVDTSAGTVSGEINHFTKFTAMAVEKAKQEKEPEVVPVLAPVINLNDIKGHWAQVQIEKLIAAGAISGYPDSTFKPDKTISRAEFAAVVVKAFKLEAKNGKVFKDTANHWAKDAIATAAAYGIVSGYDAETFAPDEFITREQMAVMISKAAKLTEIEGGKNFSDKEQVSDWARDAVNKASGHEIISGYPDNSFRPKSNATRAEAVTIITKAS